MNFADVGRKGCAIAGAIITSALLSQHAVAEWPERPIQVIVPFAAGVGLSSALATAVAVANSDAKLLPQPLQVIHVPGAGGTIGSRQVKDAAPDGYTILAFNESLATANALGISDFGHESFEPIAQIGTWCGMVLVPAASPFQSLTDLVEAAKASPNTITEAVGIGTAGHFGSLLLAEALDFTSRPVPSGGPAERMPQLAGAHVDFTLSTVNSYTQFKDLGIRALAMLAPERHPSAPDVLTAREQSLPAPDYCGSIFFLAPKGTPSPILEKLKVALEASLSHDAVKRAIDAAGMAPDFVSGEALGTLLAAQAADFDRIAKESSGLAAN